MRAAYVFPLLLYVVSSCYNWCAVVSSLSISRTTRKSFSLGSTNNIASVDACGNNATSETIYEDILENIQSELSCRVQGYYPFPTSPRQGLMNWLLKDTHQAVVVTETIPSAANITESAAVNPENIRVRMDFMTKDGANHPVWYDETEKWKVFLGGSIDGEVRVKILGAKTQQRAANLMLGQFQSAKGLPTDSLISSATFSKLQRLIAYANDYNCRMNLYTNNCRMFAARMEREVERLNAECPDSRDSSLDTVVADLRCVLRIAWAAVLPALYPVGIILLIYEGCWNI